MLAICLKHSDRRKVLSLIIGCIAFVILFNLFLTGNNQNVVQEASRRKLVLAASTFHDEEATLQSESSDKAEEKPEHKSAVVEKTGGKKYLRKLPHQDFSAGPFPVNYTFDDPANYTGPVVQGWPPAKSRFVPTYIRPDEDTILTDLSCLDLNGTKVLIIIQSNPTSLSRRSADRQTWMQLQKAYHPHVRTIFLFGTQDPAETYFPIEPERRKFCDVVQMDFVDHYDNVTLDTVSALKFVRQYNWVGSEPDFVVVGDDDTYINVPMLWAMLYEEKKMLRNSTFLLGYRFITSQVLFPADMNTAFVDRIICPTYMYNQRLYPDSLSGSLYVLPMGTVECLYSASLALPLFHINDIHVTSFAAETCGFNRVSDDRFHPGSVELKHLKPNDISFHWNSNLKKGLIHNILENQNGEMEMKMPNRYYIDNGNVVYCDKNLSCSPVSE